MQLKPKNMETATKPKLVDCPHCKGTGKQSISFQEIGKKAVPYEITCIMCDGKAKLSSREAQKIQDELDYEKMIWCKCGNTSGVTHYWPDGKGKLVHKHHYTCADCGKVVQIG